MPPKLSAVVGEPDNQPKYPATMSARILEWRTDSTARSVKLRLAFGDGTVAQGDCCFTLDPEQARQLIRDLSSAVQASDLKRALRQRARSAKTESAEETE